MDELHQKYEALKDYFRSLGSVAVAYSSGVDSTFLLRVAHDVLGEKAMAITGGRLPAERVRGNGCLLPGAGRPPRRGGL